MNPFVARYSLTLWPGAVFLFILPFTHTVTLRLSCLAIAAAVAFIAWRNRHAPPIPFKLPLSLWAGMALLSLSWALDPAYTLGEIKNEIGYTMLAFFTFYSMTQGEREWKLWNRVLILSFLAVSTSGVLGYWLARDDWNVGGFHGDVGNYSTYLITILPFLLLAAIKAPVKKFPSNLVWLLLPILLTGGYLTLNRAFWPALIAVSSIFGFLYFFRATSPRIKMRTMIVAIFLGILAVAQFVSVTKQKAVATGTGTEIVTKSIQEDPRIPIWNLALQNIKKHPLTGVGFGREASQINFYGYLHAHNLFLDYTLQMGVGGLLAIMLLLWAIGNEFWKLYCSTNLDTSLVGITGLALLGGIITKNMADDFFVRQHALLFWALVGMCLGYGKRRAQEMPPTISPNQLNPLSPP